MRFKIILGFLLICFLVQAYAEEQKYEEFIGDFKFVYKIGGIQFTDYITITKVTKQGKVMGKWTYYSGQVHGRIINNVAYVTDKGCDYFLDGWFFSAYGRRDWHMSCCDVYHDYDTSFQKMKIFVKYSTPQVLPLGSYQTMKLQKMYVRIQNLEEE